jgi:hypothetical protein
MTAIGRAALWGALLAGIAGGALAPVQPVSAQSFPPTKKAIWGPAQVDGVSQFPIYRDLGVGIYQTGVDWSRVAAQRPAQPTDPTDPAYRWSAALDYAVSQAAAHGIQVAVNVTHAPGWANGGRSSEWAPVDPEDYAAFVEAAARRYPSVRLWIIWSEPSRRAAFMVDDYDRRAPGVYAQLLDAAYGRLKGLDAGNLVIGGNTFYTGDITTLRFIDAMTLTDGRRPRLDLYGHNPFTQREPRLSDPASPHGFVDFGALDDLADHLDRVYPGQGLRLFLSEFAVPTGRPGNFFGVWESEETQARWLASALCIAARWSRVYALGWYKLYDDPPNGQGTEVLWGLIGSDGRRKPSYAVFQTPPLGQCPDDPAVAERAASTGTAGEPPGQEIIVRSRRRITLSRSGRFEFELGAQPDLGWGSVRFVVAGRAKRRFCRCRTARLAGASFPWAANKPMTLTMRLPRRHRRVLNRLRTVRVAAIIRRRDSLGRLWEKTFHFRLRAPTGLRG